MEDVIKAIEAHTAAIKALTEGLNALSATVKLLQNQVSQIETPSQRAVFGSLWGRN